MMIYSKKKICITKVVKIQNGQLYTLQNTKFLILVWVFVDDDDGDNAMIM